MRKTLPTLILDSAFIFILLHAQVGGGQQSSSWIATYNSFTDVEELFFFFCMLRLAGPQSTIWTTTFNSFTDVEEELFFFFCMLRLGGPQSTIWTTTFNSCTDVEEELFFFFYMLWIEGELQYTREIIILLLIHSQSERGVSWESLCPP